MAQYYSDGVSGRRGTIMACLAHARPTATNLGQASGTIWSESRGVAAFASYDPVGVARMADSLLVDPIERAALAGRARVLYEGHFAVDRVVDVLVHDAAWEPSGP